MNGDLRAYLLAEMGPGAPSDRIEPVSYVPRAQTAARIVGGCGRRILAPVGLVTTCATCGQQYAPYHGYSRDVETNEN